MNYGATAHGQRIIKRFNNIQQFAGSPVSVIDSIVITEELNPNVILAEWIAYDPGITVYEDLTASKSVKLFINWSDQNGAINLQEGDFFTFVVPDIFVHDYIVDVTNVPITNEIGEIVATYSIYDNASNMKEVKITFTDYVENHTNVYGVFWMVLFVGSVASTEQKDLEFVINDSLAAQGEVTVNPNLGTFTPHDNKVGFSSPEEIAGGYYVFEWLVYFNMGENEINGFNRLEGFSFEDIIPADSPHIFLTTAIRQELGIPLADYKTEIGEYTGADAVPPGDRYQLFLTQYNNNNGDSWYDFIQWHTLTDGFSTSGIDGGGGLHVTGTEVADKLFFANLGNVTRPTIIRFYTISTIKMSESALGDTEVVGLFNELFMGSYGDDLSSSLTLYRFEAGGSAQGITGDYGFAFLKVDVQDTALPGAMFALYTSENFAAGADRFVFSSIDGVVAFNNLPEGTFYFQETVPPYGYLPNNTIYKVILSSAGFEIYYGPDFETRLPDNKIVNISEIEIQPALVILPGQKNLIGLPLTDGMFHFVVKDNIGNTVSTGINSADGSILFSSIEFSEPGTFTLTVAEVEGDDNRIIYDGSTFTVIVTVSYDSEGNLTADISYPDGGIVFNNRYMAEPVQITLQGCKKLICHPLTGGMFNFTVKDSMGNTVATGTNNADGSIIFGGITFDEPGVFTFTVEEVRGSQSGIIYDGSVFTVTVTVTSDSSGNLVAKVLYPNGGIVFKNRYVPKPVCPCGHCKPCCMPCCKQCPHPCICKTLPDAPNKYL